MENPTPLNTGNGNQGNLANVPPVQQVYNTPAPTEQPRVITPEAVPPAAPVTPVSAATPAPDSSMDDEKNQKIKKYIIMAVAAIVFITIVYVAYGMFFSTKASPTSDTTTNTTTDNNSLSNSLTDKTQGNPPGLNIQLPDTTTTSSGSAVTGSGVLDANYQASAYLTGSSGSATTVSSTATSGTTDTSNPVSGESTGGKVAR